MGPTVEPVMLGRIHYQSQQVRQLPVFNDEAKMAPLAWKSLSEFYLVRVNYKSAVKSSQWRHSSDLMTSHSSNEYVATSTNPPGNSLKKSGRGKSDFLVGFNVWLAHHRAQVLCPLDFLSLFGFWGSGLGTYSTASDIVLKHKIPVRFFRRTKDTRAFDRCLLF